MLWWLAFLLHRCFETLAYLQLTLPDILNQYNNMPSGSLLGLTPNEVLNGKTPDKKLFADEIKARKKLRLLAQTKKLYVIIPAD